MTESGEFVVVDDGPEPITDIKILSKKENKHKDFELLDTTYMDKQKVNLLESSGLLSKGKRYLVVSKKYPSTSQGHCVITDLKLKSTGDKALPGYYELAQTDDDHKEAFSGGKSLLIKYTPREQAQKAIIDIIVLSSQKIRNLPEGYQRLQEINSFSLCFKIGNLSAAGKSAAKRSAGNEGSKSGSPAQPERQTSVHTVQVQPLDDVTFKLNEKNDPKSLLNKFAKPNIDFLTVQELEDKFKFDFSLEEKIITGSS